MLLWKEVVDSARFFANDTWLEKHAALLLAANSETQVTWTFTVEDSLLLVLGPELGGTQVVVHLDLVVLRHAVLMLFSVVS